MISTHKNRFIDENGRTLLLRGVNLGGSSKVPSRPNGATWVSEDFFNHREVSFVGRPFPLEEADQHFSRLRAWGYNFLRFLITWEAVEHAGPGRYDEEYLDYVRAVVKKAGEHGFPLFIDPHQDMWSRFSGGDGAPGWTLEMAGFDITRFKTSGAAVVHATHGDPLPRMIWPTNASKLAAASMFTLFFGGNDFAPLTKMEGQPAQEFLQEHYIRAVQQVAYRLNDLPNVVGYDTLNEPLRGYIGWKNLSIPGGELKLGESPSPFQAILLGSGFPQDVPFWKMHRLGIRQHGTHRVNAERQSAWQEDVNCIWRENGVWDIDKAGQPVLLRPEHFSQVNGRPVNFSQDYLLPFARRFTDAVRQADPRALIFLEAPVSERPPRWNIPGLVHAPHWYDGVVLVQKEFSPLLGVDYFTHNLVLGPGFIRRSFARQLNGLIQASRQELGGVPTLLGEFGIPFDLDHKSAFQSGDFSQQERALERSFRALEDTLLSGTLWNYTSDNSNARGDLWNDEDFSIFCRDQQSDPSDIYSGGRALYAAVRPYPRAIPGEPLLLSFDSFKHVFQFRYRPDPAVSAPLEIFVPRLHYPQGYQVKLSAGSYESHSEEQLVIIHPAAGEKEQSVRIQPAG